MTKDFFKMFSGMNDTEFEKMIENAAKAVAKFCDEFAEKNDETEDEPKNESYYSELKKEYVDGELVKKSEKEYVNGKCTKDEEFDASKMIGECEDSCDKCKASKLVSKSKKDDDGYRANMCKCNTPKIDSTIKKNEELTKQIEDMTRYIDKLNDKINELEKKNHELSIVINNVKKCF